MSSLRAIYSSSRGSLLRGISLHTDDGTGKPLCISSGFNGRLPETWLSDKGKPTCSLCIKRGRNSLNKSKRIAGAIS